jgi:MFS family permease
VFDNFSQVRTIENVIIAYYKQTYPTDSPLGSSIFAPGIEQTMVELHETSNAVGSLMITIFLMGYAIGPLFLAPLSEIYGRYPVIVLSCWFFNAFLIGCGFAPNMPGLIVMRFLAGTGGSAVMAIAPAIVADLYPVERRSFAMGIVLVCPACRLMKLFFS